MKIKNGFVVKKVAGQDVVIALGSASKIFNGIIKLNESARFIWDKLAEGADRDAIVSALLEEYEIDEQTAGRDVDNFIEQLKGANILE